MLQYLSSVLYTLGLAFVVYTDKRFTSRNCVFPMLYSTYMRFVISYANASLRHFFTTAYTEHHGAGAIIS